MEKKKNLTVELHEVLFLKPKPLSTKERVLVAFLVRFGLCNQAKSLAPTLKILLVFLCEAAANQLQQSKDCCGVSHILGFKQRSKPRTGICALDWLVTYLGAVHQKGELSLENKSNWVLG